MNSDIFLDSNDLFPLLYTVESLTLGTSYDVNPVFVNVKKSGALEIFGLFWGVLDFFGPLTL